MFVLLEARTILLSRPIVLGQPLPIPGPVAKSTSLLMKRKMILATRI